MERSRPIERLADALQECLNEAAELGAQKVNLNEAAERGAQLAAQKVKEELVPRLDRLDRHDDALRVRLDRQDDTLRLRLDRQDETLRLIWKQVKGSGRLPIDE